MPIQSSFPLSEITVSLRRFCEFIRTEIFYEKSLAKWAELYYNITVLFFGIERHLYLSVICGRTIHESLIQGFDDRARIILGDSLVFTVKQNSRMAGGETEFGDHDTENRIRQRQIY